MPKPLPPPPPPPNAGRILIPYDDLDQLRFWVRVFQIEKEVEATQVLVSQQLNKQGEPAAYAAVPVISEYTSGQLYWTYVLVLFIDRLGISGGSGVIYYADKENLSKMQEKRDKFADDILKSFREGNKPLHEIVIQPGAEKDVG